ncbi:MAG: hypothetical protein COW24_01600 [Candidatus Kerfeldbacteria bacterium CG15_BIG_FIL_POST_REV_8_21_14_020_45_12]|uniref:DNA recombination protein RmuC n=1 Tax=Candidatus Kerfeldbacteria bacterium CG15_BIG_FIL_POST_REV_8_21_14_020_45_12 TaxID=2014247 RepID=A0A2M7H4I7_9BACT|nr:MAG: hypothetical protein COW24_01600 [Candidatus Kerfeldbacteria bacterium CG15_BIG_FIL_POST_REV_8_21_14_020_45_12]PJA92939.1 MAG: hypothetical protein CO132_05520 [Candidatus Kerfeldbacteria bacterium CG_4_9_14_3_um_filter_45_8]
MENIIVLTLIALAAINLVGIIIIFRRVNKGDSSKDAGIGMMNQNIQGMQDRLDKVSLGLNERLDNAARVIGEVNKELGTMQEIGRSMNALQDFLKSPKLRGNIGEQVLKDMLDQYFPQKLYQMQYKFTEGQVVDAVLKTDNGIIPIDAKFPMENYQRMAAEEGTEARERYSREFIKDVKRHVDAISKKYILPDEGTVDFAIMYVPAESVYYEIIRNDSELNAYSISRKVLYVSPNSFYYFLHILMMGMQEKKMAEAAKEMIASIRGIQKDAVRFGETLGVLNRHITNAKSALDRTSSDYDKLSGKIERIDHFEDQNQLEQ